MSTPCCSRSSSNKRSFCCTFFTALPGLSDNGTATSPTLFFATAATTSKNVKNLLFSPTSGSSSSNNNDSTFADPNSQTLLSDWAEATRRWKEQFQSQCFARDQFYDEAREAERRRSFLERERVEERAARLEADFDEWQSAEWNANGDNNNSSNPTAAAAAARTTREQQESFASDSVDSSTSKGGGVRRNVQRPASAPASRAASSSSSTTTTTTNNNNQGSAFNSNEEGLSSAAADLLFPFATRQRISDLMTLLDIPRGMLRPSDYTSHLSACGHHRRGQHKDAILIFNSIIETCNRQQQSSSSSASFSCGDDSASSGSSGSSTSCLAALYANRAAAHLALSDVAQCLSDSLRSIECDRRIAISHIRASRCHLILLNFRQAKQYHPYLQQLKRENVYDPQPDISAMEELEKYRSNLNDNLQESALFNITTACQHVCSMRLEVLRLELMAECRPDEAMEEVAALIESGSGSGSGGGLQQHQQQHPPEVMGHLFYLRALLLYRQSTDTLSIGVCQQDLHRCTSLLSDHTKGKTLLALLKQIDHFRSMALTYANTRRWKQCHDAYTALLNLRLGNERIASLFLTQRAQACLGLGSYPDAIQDCAKALGYKDSCVNPALVRGIKADAHAALKQFDAAVKEAEESYKLHQTPQMFDKVELYKKLRSASFHQQTNYSKAQSNSGTYYQNGGGNAWRNNSGNGSGNNYQKQQEPQEEQQQQQQQKESSSSANYSTNGTATPSHYELLGVTKDTPMKRILKAYRGSALKWHPDRWMTAPPEARVHAEERFKLINHAYSVIAQQRGER